MGNMEGRQNISADCIDRFVFNDNFIIIDLRDREAYEKRHITNSVNIPYMDNVPYRENINRIISELHSRIPVLYCDRGVTGLMVARGLAAGGFRVLNVIGGITAYRGKFVADN